MPDSDRDPLSHAVLGAAFEVANVLGRGFLEAVYRRALVVELRRRGAKVAEEVPFTVLYKGTDVGRYVADIVVEDSMIVELKTTEALTGAHIAQTLNYLTVSAIPVALLITFGKPRVEYKRLVR